jgi:mRNA interferase RelE/StbE
LDELENFINNFDKYFEKVLIKLTKIKALKEKFKGLYRRKLRTYRIIYEKKNNILIILILRVSH